MRDGRGHRGDQLGVAAGLDDLEVGLVRFAAAAVEELGAEEVEGPVGADAGSRGEGHGVAFAVAFNRVPAEGQVGRRAGVGVARRAGLARDQARRRGAGAVDGRFEDVGAAVAVAEEVVPAGEEDPRAVGADAVVEDSVGRPGRRSTEWGSPPTCMYRCQNWLPFESVEISLPTTIREPSALMPSSPTSPPLIVVPSGMVETTWVPPPFRLRS